jgi:hypothetical protein
MEHLLRIKDERAILIRLTALWALNEAGLGGLMHLVRSPFTGIFVGGAAVLLISLIGYTAKKPGAAILRALLIVLVIKAAVSPHSPPTAYIAVAFQGLLGALLFSSIPNFRLAALLLAPLALVESALQKLLVMTILFGMPLWKSINAFIDSVLQKFGLLAEGMSVGGVNWIVGAYVGGYFLAGVFIGWLAGRLPAEIDAAAQRLSPPAPGKDEAPDAPKPAKPFWKKRQAKWIAGTLLLLLLIYLFVPGAREGLSPLWLIARVALVIGVWYWLVAPTLMRLMQGFLKKKASAYQEEVDAALGLLPVFRHLARSAWQETGDLRGWRRAREFAVRAVTYALLFTKK